MPNNRLSKKAYDFIYDRVPRLCVDLVILDKNGIVLTFRKIEPAKNKWHLPGGRVYYKETVEHAAQRIAKEELGTKIGRLNFLGFMEMPSEKQNGKVRHSVSLAFLGNPLSAKITGSWQAQKVKSFKKLPKSMHKIHAKFLKEHKILK